MKRPASRVFFLVLPLAGSDTPGSTKSPGAILDREAARSETSPLEPAQQIFFVCRVPEEPGEKFQSLFPCLIG